MAITGEGLAIWTEERLKTFLQADSFDGDDVDYVAVIRAYRHMPPEIFTKFVALYVAEGHDLNAKNRNGETLVQTISSHTQGAEYVEILKAAGAA
jgi:hypothetical protein